MLSYNNVIFPEIGICFFGIVTIPEIGICFFGIVMSLGNPVFLE